jgi:glyoxylase-like metal-dependent hydrolase (beta-lactamase superfamily II)
MRFVFKIFKIIVAALVLLVATVAVLLYLSFSGNLPIKDGERIDGVEVVKDGIVSAFIVDAGDNSVALVDASNDRQAKAIVLALARRNLGPGAVKAIFLTHGDRDHTAGALAFPQAQVMVLEPDVGLAEGREARGIFKIAGTHPTGMKITRVLRDGETVTVGDLPVRVFAVPGHTKGSAAFLARGVLFMGDSAEATKEGKLAPGKRLTSESPEQNRASLRQLATRLLPMSGEIKAIAPAHSGVLTKGLAPLTEYAATPK